MGSSGCTCTLTPVPDEAWTDKGEVPPPVEDRVRLIDTDPECPHHGDGTEHQRHIQERARELAEQFGLLPDIGRRPSDGE